MTDPYTIEQHRSGIVILKEAIRLIAQARNMLQAIDRQEFADAADDLGAILVNLENAG